MYYHQYRKWVNDCFKPVLQDVTSMMTSPFTTRQLAKTIRLVASDPYRGGEMRKSIYDCQFYYRAMIDGCHRRPGRTDWLFFEFGDRLTRALNTAVDLGFVTRTMFKQTTIIDGRKTIRTIYNYVLK